MVTLGGKFLEALEYGYKMIDFYPTSFKSQIYVSYPSNPNLRPLSPDILMVVVVENVRHQACRAERGLLGFNHRTLWDGLCQFLVVGLPYPCPKSLECSLPRRLLQMDFALKSNGLISEVLGVNYKLCGRSHASDVFKILANDYLPRSNSFEEFHKSV